jgi:hypothetical protein
MRPRRKAKVTGQKIAMEIINAHAHIYPEKIAEKATTTIGIFYDI